MAAPKWTPPPDPDLLALADACWREWYEDRPTVVAFDTETTGLEHHDTAFCATFAWRRPSGEITGHYLEFDALPDDLNDAAMATACMILGAADVVVAHNWKFDAHKVAAKLGYTFPARQDVHDTEAMAHLIDEHRPKGLKALAVSVLGFDDTIDVPGKMKDKDEDSPTYGKQIDVIRKKPRSVVELGKAKEWAKKAHGLKSVKDVGYHLLPRGVVVPYAILDAVWTFQLADAFYPEVSRYSDLFDLYRAEMLLARTAIFDMEEAGMGVDMAYVDAQLSEFRVKLLDHEGTIEQIVGRPVRTGHMTPKERPLFFNPASTDEVAEYLTAATGEEVDSTDEEHLEQIDHPLARALLAYRKDAKLLGYFEGLKKGTVDGVFHPSLRQHGTVSGRTSAGKERGD